MKNQAILELMKKQVILGILQRNEAKQHRKSVAQTW